MKIGHPFSLQIIALLAINLGCTQTESAFEICSDFCSAAAQCAWDDSAQEFNTPGSYHEDQCMNNCSFYSNSGAFVVRRSTVCEEYDDEANVCWKQAEQEEFLGNVGSPAVKRYLGCVVDLDAWKCNGGRYGMVIESAEECSDYAVCIDTLGSNYIPTPQWNNGQCVSTSETNDAFYLDIVL